jgi:hypothetical protein
MATIHQFGLDWNDQVPLAFRHLVCWQRYREEPYRSAKLLSPPHLHFIEAEEAGLLRDGLGHGGDGILRVRLARGVQALNDLGARLKATDAANYEAKRRILVNSLKPVFAKIPPGEWAATFQRAYDNLPTLPTPVPPTPPVAKPTNTPLRASNPAGAAAPAPKSLAEAIDFGKALMTFEALRDRSHGK